MMAKRNAPPRAAALVESLRGLGYSPATAFADIIDNSIAAGANTVELVFEWDGADSWIKIVDDGKGMTADELDSAMRLGDRNPLETRSSDDLGRFGLGLKTASFSQARRLTVASRTHGQGVECLRWDLDVLAASNGDEWFLLEGPEAGSEVLLVDLVERANGTIVLLEKLDRIVTSGFSATDFLDLIDGVEQHLSMTFHRYLGGTDPRLRILINGAPITPWDPFMTGHPSKPWVKPQVRLPWTSPVFVECHVLPHKDKLSSREQELAAGPQGWSGGQGFYVYRNERLIVSGNWLGLGTARQWTKDEAYRLARIRLDITNEADAAWKLDIRKSTARPPVELRRMLTRLAEETRDRARQVFAHRGGIVTASRKGDPIEPLWEASKTSKGTRYRISRGHDAVRALLDRAPDLLPEFEALLRLVEETVPVQRIWLDTTEDRETPLTGFVGEPSAEIMSVLRTMYRSLLRKAGMSPQAARRRLSSMEPFDKYSDLVAALPDDVDIDGEVE
jgi:hypothetical protein